MRSFNPFDNVPYKTLKIKKTKTSRSKIPNMSIGDVRYTFYQLRGFEDINTERVLWNGSTCGDFGLLYVSSYLKQPICKNRLKLLKHSLLVPP